MNLDWFVCCIWHNKWYWWIYFSAKFWSFIWHYQQKCQHFIWNQIHQNVNSDLIDQIITRYLIVWLKTEWIIDISEKYWMQIYFKNNWKIINAKLKHKFYSVSVNKHVIINEILDKLHNQEKTYWTQNSAFYTCSVFVTW